MSKLLLLTSMFLVLAVVTSSPLPGVDTDSNDTHNWGKECEEPCSGPQCDQFAEMMRFLVDFTVDPCDDFFGFACSAKTRGTKSLIPKKLTMDFKQLVKFPPKGFEYVKKFYLSCTRINTSYTTEEVFMQCFKDGKCDERELMKYGDIFTQFLRFTYEFINKTMLPVVTSDWEERTRDIFGGQGWNWWDFASSGFKDFFFLEAFHTVVKYENVLALDIFRSNIFFTPMIDSIWDDRFDLYPMIHIVPMSVPEMLNGNDTEYFNRYKSFMRSFFLAFGANFKSIDDEVEKIFYMEQQVGKINPNVWFYPAYEPSDYKGTDEETLSNSTNSNLNETSDILDVGYFKEIITIEELYHLVPSVEWKDYIEGAFNHNFKVRKTTKVRIPSRSLMVDMEKWIESLSSRDKANLLIWRMFIKFGNDFMHTGAEVGDLQQNVFSSIFPHQQISSIIENETRADNCIKQIETFFPFAHDDMFISKYIDNKTREAIRKTFKGLTREFEEIIEETEWMSQRTQIRAIEKLRAMNIIVGETSPNTKAFKALKKQMSSKNYIENILAISNYNWITLSKNINKEKKVASYPADTKNAYYSQIKNEVEIKTGLITDWINGQGLSFDFPTSLIFGGFVSTTLGHEMVHGFDGDGKKYDKDGFRLNWWKPSEDEIYANRTQCLIDQYANFTIAYNGTEYQISETLYPTRENIADNGGVKAAYRSYQRLPEDQKKCLSDPDLPFTADQLFFLGHAIDWCTFSGHEYVEFEDYKSLLTSKPSEEGHFPAPWRVNTVLANQPEFAKAFKCSVGSRLNPRPENRCMIW